MAERYRVEVNVSPASEGYEFKSKERLSIKLVNYKHRNNIAMTNWWYPNIIIEENSEDDRNIICFWKGAVTRHFAWNCITIEFRSNSPRRRLSSDWKLQEFWNSTSWEYLRPIVANRRFDIENTAMQPAHRSVALYGACNKCCITGMQH